MQEVKRAVQTYTIKVKGISEETLRRLDRRAQETGRDRSQFIREVLEEKLLEAEKVGAGPTFAEIVAPLQADFEATGMTDEELGEFLDAEIKAYRAERRMKASQTSGG